MDALRDMEAKDEASIIPIVWTIYTEHGWPHRLGGTPTAAEWKTLRRWARTWIRRQDATKRRALGRWATLDSVPTEEIRRLAQFATQPDTVGWPSDTLHPPDTPEELLLLQMALCMRPQQWMA